MHFFEINGKKLVSIKEESFDSEKTIHDLISNEENLKNIFGYEFIKNEFQVKNRYLDTLAFKREEDPKMKNTKKKGSFVIIEFKNDKNVNVFDQGMNYLSIMLDNRAEFVLEYNRIKGRRLSKEDIDWSGSRVIIISPNFTEIQRGAVNFKDIPIELWEFKKFGKVVLLNSITPASTASYRILNSGEKYKTVSSEVQVYDLDYHVKGKDDMRDLFICLQEKIIGLGGNIKEYFGKSTIYYKTKGLAFIYIWFTQTTMVADLRINKAEAIEGVIRNRNVKQRDSFKVRVTMRSDKDIDTVFASIRKAYQSL